MNEPEHPPATPESEPADTPAPAQSRKSISMHEDVPVWYDCCSCEAEPYWAELERDPEESS